MKGEYRYLHLWKNISMAAISVLLRFICIKGFIG